VPWAATAIPSGEQRSEMETVVELINQQAVGTKKRQRGGRRSKTTTTQRAVLSVVSKMRAGAQIALVGTSLSPFFLLRCERQRCLSTIRVPSFRSFPIEIMMSIYLSTLLAITILLPAPANATGSSLLVEATIDAVPLTPPAPQQPRGLRAYATAAGMHQDYDQGPSSTLQFDFLVAGFSKCGTTVRLDGSDCVKAHHFFSSNTRLQTLLKTFAAHPETSMAAQEQCAVAAPSQTDLIVLQKLQEARTALSMVGGGGAADQTTAFKCPNAMYTYKSIIRLEKHSPQVRLVIGIRHPVLMMESYFNYRITEMYNGKQTEAVPDFASLVLSGGNWKGVNLGCTRFDLFLMQLGQTDLTADHLDEMAVFSNMYGYDMAVKPCNFPIFLYTVEQLDDTDEDRSAVFRATMQEFLQLRAPIPPFGHENINHATGEAGFAESIDICHVQYDAVRRLLIDNARRASTWIINYFIASPGVVVANPEHFVAALKDWTHDPCTTKDESSPATAATGEGAVATQS
jgi:hypothetical protein